MAGLLRNVQHIDRPDPGCEERLVGITPGSVHNETALVLSDRLCESRRAFFEDDVPPAVTGRLGAIIGCAITAGEVRHHNLALELGLANLTLNLTAIHGEVTKVSQQLLSTILTTNESE